MKEIKLLKRKIILYLKHSLWMQLGIMSDIKYLNITDACI